MALPSIVTVHDLTFSLLLDEEQIRRRVRELGETIRTDYAGKKPLFLGILNGAFIFGADLIRHFEGPCEVTFIRVSSYAGMQSSGVLKEVLGLDEDIAGRDIILVEDIIDSGRTLHHLIHSLNAQQPASVCIAALLRKPEALVFDVPARYVGFDIDDRFVVGYGLDYDGLGRNLPGVYQKIDL